jgi:hypothetical protein
MQVTGRLTGWLGKVGGIWSITRAMRKQYCPIVEQCAVPAVWSHDTSPHCPRSGLSFPGLHLIANMLLPVGRVRAVHMYGAVCAACCDSKPDGASEV